MTAAGFIWFGVYFFFFLDQKTHMNQRCFSASRVNTELRRLSCPHENKCLICAAACAVVANLQF